MDALGALACSDTIDLPDPSQASSVAGYVPWGCAVDGVVVVTLGVFPQVLLWDSGNSSVERTSMSLNDARGLPRRAVLILGASCT